MQEICDRCKNGGLSADEIIEIYNKYFITENKDTREWYHSFIDVFKSYATVVLHVIRHDINNDERIDKWDGLYNIHKGGMNIDFRSYIIELTEILRADLLHTKVYHIKEYIKLHDHDNYTHYSSTNYSDYNRYHNDMYTFYVECLRCAIKHNNEYVIDYEIQNFNHSMETYDNNRAFICSAICNVIYKSSKRQSGIDIISKKLPELFNITNASNKDIIPYLYNVLYACAKVFVLDDHLRVIGNILVYIKGLNVLSDEDLSIWIQKLKSTNRRLGQIIE